MRGDLLQSTGQDGKTASASEGASSSRQIPSADNESAPKVTVAYFYDLFAQYNDPELAHATLRVLGAHGINVLLPEQRASGIPEMLYGYARHARSIAAFNVRALLPVVQAGAVVVSAEPTASFAFKVHYPDYLPGRDCSLVANATRDLSEFLLSYRANHPHSSPPAGHLRRSVNPTGGAAAWLGPKEGPLTTEIGPALRIAYHQPCHLKAQQVGNPAIELIGEIPGVEVIDLDAGCCGMAGTFGMKRGTYDLSMRTGAPLFERIAELAPALVASECSTCRMQIAQATGLRTVHPITLLDEAYS
jgi:glycerol-3-phosphate dehydrogenase subunit C